MNLLDQFKKRLLENGNSSSKVTVKNYVADIKKFIIWFETNYKRPFPPPALPFEVVDFYLKPLIANSPRSGKRYQSSLKKFFSYLQKEGHLSYNPLLQEIRPKINQDPWHLKDFGSFLYESKASALTIKNYMQDVKQFLAWTEAVGTKGDAFASINSFMLEEYKNRLINEVKLSPLSVNRKLSSLRKYLNWALGKNLLKNKNVEVPNIQKIEADSEVTTNLIHDDSNLSPDTLLNTPGLQPSLLKPTDLPGNEQNGKARSFSKFPPLRLLQMTKWALGAAFDALIILSIIKSFEAIKYNLWKATGKEVFASLPTIINTIRPGSIPQPEIRVNKNLSVVDQFITMGENTSIGKIRSIPKSAYAPLKISTDSLPFWKRLTHKIRYSRPRWYKIYHNYSFAHYLHFAIVLIFTSFAGFTIYNTLKTPVVHQNVLAEKIAPSRLISFNGRLNDASDAPITNESFLKFAIYRDDVASGSAKLWEERQRIVPQPDGTFSTILGKKTPINQEIFVENPSLYLGISIGSDPELKPRQELASVTLTKDSQALQGLKPITGNNSDTANVILALDSSGNLTIGGSASPVFQATGGEFKLSGQQLTLTSNEGSNGNIQIVPDGTGFIDLQKPIKNTSENNNLASALGAVEVDDNFAILASSSAQSALIINQNSTGNLISASTGGVAKFTVDNLGSGTFGGDVNILGNSLSTSTNSFNIANQNTTNLNIGGAATSVFIGATTGNTVINNNLKVAGALTLSGFTPGSIVIVNNEGQIAQDNASFFWDSANKRLGLGTASPTKMLDVQGEIQVNLAGPQTSFALCGSHSAGSGKESIDVTIVDCAGTPAADYMELYSTESDVELGDIVVPSSAYATTKDNERLSKLTKSTQPYQSSVIGIISDKNKAGDFNSVGHNIKPEDNPQPVALSGRVPVKIASDSAPIKPGDYLASSSVPGRAMKAENAGIMVGKALEEWNPGTNQNSVMVYVTLSWFDPKYEIKDDGNLLAIEKANDDSEAKAMLNQTIVDLFSFSGNFISTLKIGAIEAQKISVNSLSVATEDIMIGGQTLRNYIAQIVNEMMDKRLASLKIDGIAEADISKEKVSVVSPLASTSAETKPTTTPPTNTYITNVYNNAPSLTGSNSAIIESDSTPSTTPTPNVEPTPTSGIITPTVIPEATPTPSPSPAVLPTPFPSPTPIGSSNTDLSASAEALLNTTSSNVTTKNADLASLSAELSYVPNLKANFGKFEYGLIALGPTSLAETSINGQLTIGSSMTIAENEINTFGADLSLQPLRQGNLTIMGGLFSIDTEGNMKVEGNATFAKDVKVQGTLSATLIAPVPDNDLILKIGQQGKDGSESELRIQNASSSAVLSVSSLGDLISSGSAKFANIKIIRGAQADTSPTQTTAGGSAGTAVITANQTERTIITPFATEGALIYITPVTNTQGTTPYIARQSIEDSRINSKGSFTIQIAQPVTQDIKLNWWIIN